MKRGLLGGTFDPIHIGHLIIAEEVSRRLEFDKIIFMPARHPWLKADREIADERHRLAMTKLATATMSSMMFIGLASWPRETAHSVGGGSGVTSFGP